MRSATAPRLGFLDALRAVAVLFVLAQHVGEQLSPAFVHFTSNYWQIGQMGVMVFFLCSGFIIPASLERNNSLGTFWVSRIFRLYPLYWFSLALAAVYAGLSIYRTPTALDTGDWLVNITMLQRYLGSPDAIGLYWSLGFEMAFYFIVTVLFAFGLHKRSVLWSLCASAACIMLALVYRPLTGSAMSIGFFCVATMLTGTVYNRWHAGTVRLRTLVGCVVFALVAGVLVLYSALWGRQEVLAGGGQSFTPMVLAWVGAYAVFSLGVWGMRSWAPRPLRWIGEISYSIYLTQALVIDVIPRDFAPPVVLGLVWVIGTIAFSAVTYYLIEKPMIKVGKRVIAARRTPTAHAKV